MGYAVYKNGDRYAGYGVPAVCEHPDCDKEIDRGMSHACGGEPFSEYGCDRYFCGEHLKHHGFNTGCGYKENGYFCDRCSKMKTPFPKKPETKEWMNHLLTDESWEKWRENNPEEVKEFQDNLKEA